MTLVNITLVFLILNLIPITPSMAAEETETCNSRYSNGTAPTTSDLEQIERSHQAWLKNGKKDTDPRRAKLCNADLTQIEYWNEYNFDGADLRRAKLKGAVTMSLSGADLRGADLSDSIFTQAEFINANLSGASLRNATIPGDFKGADLSNADLSGA